MNSYFDQMVLSATPVELIRLLYQKAVLTVREAREHLSSGRIEERVAAIGLSYRILTELMNSLNAESAPELAQRLTGLYCYMQERLVKANLEQTDAPLAEVLGLLVTLAEAWNEVPAVDTSAAAGGWNPSVCGTEERVVLTA